MPLTGNTGNIVTGLLRWSRSPINRRICLQIQTQVEFSRVKENATVRVFIVSDYFHRELLINNAVSLKYSHLNVLLIDSNVCWIIIDYSQLQFDIFINLLLEMMLIKFMWQICGKKNKPVKIQLSYFEFPPRGTSTDVHMDVISFLNRIAWKQGPRRQNCYSSDCCASIWFCVVCTSRWGAAKLHPTLYCSRNVGQAAVMVVLVYASQTASRFIQNH